LLLDSSNTSLISSNISTITNEFEQTTITGGTAVFDTTVAFSPFYGLGLLHSELTFNFDKNLTEFRVLSDLTATASNLNVSAVPIPGSLVLLFSGVMLLTSVSRRRKSLC